MDGTMADATLDIHLFLRQVFQVGILCHLPEATRDPLCHQFINLGHPGATAAHRPDSVLGVPLQVRMDMCEEEEEEEET